MINFFGLRLVFTIGLYLVMFSSCGPNVEDVLISNNKRISLGFADAQVELPGNYVSITIANLLDSVSSSDYPEYMKIEQRNRYLKTKTFPASFEIYCDSSNYENSIWFQEGEHIVLSKQVASGYLSLLEEAVVSNYVPLGIVAERLENKYYSGSSAQMIKLKYELTTEDHLQYYTQYVISGMSQTVCIHINHLDEEDHEELIKKIVIG